MATGFGAVLSFTTAAAPTVTTSAATAVASTTATFNGAAIPNLAAATGYFRYATTSPGTCNDTFGTRAPTTGGAALGAGSTSVPYALPVTGLSPGTTYFYCALASNSVGVGVGTVLTFTTAAAPTVTSEAASAISGSGATLNGTANPNLAATTGWFRYSATDPGACDDTFGTRAPATGGTAVGAGASPVPYGQAITGLAPATTYYYCAIASNSAGTSFGAVRTVITSTATPVVVTNPATGVENDAAVLNGAANPNGAATTGWFRYGTTNPGACNDSFGVRVPIAGGQALGAGITAVPYSEAVTGLTDGLTYYYCAIASNAVGTGFGALQMFVAGGVPPSVITELPTNVGNTTATVNGTANPNGSDAIGWFRYGDHDPVTCDDSFGTRAPATGGTALGAGMAAVPFALPLSALEPNFTFYYCAAASNMGGATFGQVRSFTTSSEVPLVRTVDAVSSPNGVVNLSGAANPRGAATNGWFRYDTVDPGTCNDTFGIRVPGTEFAALGLGRVEVPYTLPVSGLVPGTYYMCAIASNVAGTAFGEVLQFEVSDAEPPGEGGCCQTSGGTLPPAGTMVTLIGAALLLFRRRRRR